MQEELGHPDFWGLREFYSTVRAINTALARMRKEGEAVALDADMLLWAILRNFGGRPLEVGAQAISVSISIISALHHFT